MGQEQIVRSNSLSPGSVQKHVQWNAAAKAGAINQLPTAGLAGTNLSIKTTDGAALAGKMRQYNSQYFSNTLFKQLLIMAQQFILLTKHVSKIIIQ